METCIKKVRELPDDFKSVKTPSTSTSTVPMTMSPIDMSVLANRVYDDDSETNTAMLFKE